MKSASLIVLLSLVTLSVSYPNYLQCDRTVASDFPQQSPSDCTTDIVLCVQGANGAQDIMANQPRLVTSLFTFPTCIETSEQVTFQLGTNKVFHASAGTSTGNECQAPVVRESSQTGIQGVTYTAPASPQTVTFLVGTASDFVSGVTLQETDVSVQSVCPTPAPVPTPPPVSTPAPVCLAGDMTAETPQGQKLVEDIKTGDMVATGTDTFEPVLFNGFHRTKDNKRSNKEVQTTFVEIELEDHRKIMLSPAHFAITREGEVPARNVKVGDTIENGRVLRTRLVSKMGAYNPQTKSRKILVNEVVVSTKTEADPMPEWVLGAALTVLNTFYAVVPVPVYVGIVDYLTERVVEPVYYGEVGGIENYVLGIAAVLVVRKFIQK